MVPISGGKRKGAAITGPASKRERGATSGSEGVKATAALPCALVKIFGGQYSLFMHAELISMGRTELLKKLAKDDVFRFKLKDVPLDDCIVSIVKSKSDEEPSLAEEGAAVQLKGRKTLADHASGLPKATNLFIRVELPGAAAGKGEQTADWRCAHTATESLLMRVANMIHFAAATQALSTLSVCCRGFKLYIRRNFKVCAPAMASQLSATSVAESRQSRRCVLSAFLHLLFVDFTASVFEIFSPFLCRLIIGRGHVVS